MEDGDKEKEKEDKPSSSCYRYCSSCGMITVHVYIGWGEWQCAECRMGQKRRGE